MDRLFCPFCRKKCENQSGLTSHVGRCKTNAKRLANALDGYQEPERASKRQCPGSRLPPLSPSIPDAPEIGFNRATVVSFTPPVEDNGAIAQVPQPTLGEDDIDVEAPPRRPARHRKKNVLYKDFVDSREEYGNIEALDSNTSNESSLDPPIVANASLTVCSTSDTFGLRRFYYEKPSHTPHPIALLNTGSHESELLIGPREAVSNGQSVAKPLGPLENESEVLLVDWFSRNPRNTVNSFVELKALFENPAFKPEQLPSANVMLSHLSSLGVLDSDGSSLPDWLAKDAGWKRSSVSIMVPFAFRKASIPLDDHRTFEARGILDGSLIQYDRGGPQEFIVNDFYHRSLVEIMRARLKSKSFQQMHLHPYELRWKPGEGKAAARVYGEMYASPYFLREHVKLQNSAPRPHQYPRAVLGLIYFSDGTQLTSFGDANFWPGYLQFGNNSKYDRMKPSLHMTEHFAYFRKLPPAFKAFVHQHNGGLKSTSHVLTHCRRELFHAQWQILLDDEFVDAYQNGILEECFDGITRLFFPRIFVYAADYLEKVLISTIKYLSTYPCPECYVKMEDVVQLGLPEDMVRRSEIRIDDRARIKKVAVARNAVYKDGASLQSKKLAKYLEKGSYTITQNAFSKRLSHLGFNFFSMFRNEVLHEWSSNGEGKKLHVHLLRILDTVPSKLAESDSRYREIPSFGKDGIRKFRRNVSETSFQAARDVEDIIQCALPVYEDLLPEPVNSQILDLLYTMAEWQALAKLRLHTDHTLHLLDQATSKLGAEFRRFVEDLCPQFRTMELKHEVAKRVRREAKVAETKDSESQGDGSKKQVDDAKGSKQIKGKRKGKAESNSKQQEKSKKGKEKEAVENVQEPPIDKTEIATSRRECTISLRSYKLHALGHIVKSIKDLGKTELYSSEAGEAEHRIGKRRYLRTDGKDYTRQLAQLDRREARLRRIHDQLMEQGNDAAENDFLKADEKMSMHHEMGLSQNNRLLMAEFMSKNRGDPAAWDFISRLKWHLLPRIKALTREALAFEIAKEEMHSSSVAATALESLDTPDGPYNHLCVVFQNSEAIFQHNVFRVNYTAYDTRRQQDVLNPGTDHKDIMLLSGSREEPRYRYARVLGVFHCNIQYNGPKTPLTDFRRVEFLWVRWFRTINLLPRRLESLEFVSFEDEGAFGFLDPQEVIRAVHIMPRFSKGFTHPDRKGCSRLCHDGSDYRQYCVGRFSDKDLYMRSLWGLGVGHIYSHCDSPNELPSGLEWQPDSSFGSFWSNEELDAFESANVLANQDVEDDLQIDEGDIEGLIDEPRPEEGLDDEGGLIDDAHDDDDLDDQTFYARWGV